MLGYPHDVRQMLLCQNNGILKYMKPGSYLIDHTTSSPALAVLIASEASARKVNSVDAPVSGGDIGAKNGNLVTMCGGEKNHIEHLMPLLKIYSAEV